MSLGGLSGLPLSASAPQMTDGAWDEVGGGSCGTVMRTPQRHCSIPARVSRRHGGPSRRRGHAST